MTPSKILVGVLAAATCVGQQTTTSLEETRTSQSSSTTTTMQTGSAAIAGNQAQRSRMATEMLRHVHQAREAIEQDNRIQALQHVKEARSAFDRLDQAMSAETSKVVPIYEELEQVSIIGPIKAAKQSSEGEGAGRASADRAAPGAVQEAAAEYTVISLDTTTVKPHLEAVEAALEQGNLRQADAGLKTIQSGVNLASVSSDLPLLRARQNLAMAHRLASEGRHQEAGAPLKEAAEALNTYATTLTGTRAAEATRMRDEIRDFARNIGQNPSDAAGQISTWWDRTTGWTASEPKQ